MEIIDNTKSQEIYDKERRLKNETILQDHQWIRKIELLDTQLDQDLKVVRVFKVEVLLPLLDIRLNEPVVDLSEAVYANIGRQLLKSGMDNSEKVVV